MSTPHGTHICYRVMTCKHTCHIIRHVSRCIKTKILMFEIKINPKEFIKDEESSRKIPKNGNFITFKIQLLFTQNYFLFDQKLDNLSL